MSVIVQIFASITSDCNVTPTCFEHWYPSSVKWRNQIVVRYQLNENVVKHNIYLKRVTSYSSQEPLSDHTQEPLSDHTQEPLSDHTQIWKFKKTKHSLFYILSLYYLYPYKAWWCPFGPKHVTCSMWICFCNKCLVIFDFFFIQLISINITGCQSSK